LGTYHWEKVDVVLSGINLGSNLGNAMWHSGTLAAAKQAVLLGMRGIALSLVITENDPDFEALRPSLQLVLKLLLEDPKLSLVNVNFPDRTPRGLSWTRQSVRYYDGKIVPGQDPQGRRLFWFTVAPLQGAEIGTDRWAVEQGYVSMTPLRLDLTNEEELTAVKGSPPLGDATKEESRDTRKTLHPQCPPFRPTQLIPPLHRRNSPSIQCFICQKGDHSSLFRVYST